MTTQDRETMLADTSTDRINTICNQRMLRSVKVLCYHNLTQHRNDFIV
jgi:hypothetical protein